MSRRASGPVSAHSPLSHTLPLPLPCPYFRLLIVGINTNDHLLNGSGGAGTCQRNLLLTNIPRPSSSGLPAPPRHLIKPQPACTYRSPIPLIGARGCSLKAPPVAGDVEDREEDLTGIGGLKTPSRPRDRERKRKRPRALVFYLVVGSHSGLK